MKASGTAANARQDRAHRKAQPAKPDASAQAKAAPAEAKKAARPVAARAAATAVATKTGAPVAKKAAAPEKQAPAADSAEVPAKPAAAAPTAAPADAQKDTKGDAKPAVAKTSARVPPAEPAADTPAPPASDSAPATAAPAQPVEDAPADVPVSAQQGPRPPADAARRPGTPGMHTGPIAPPRIPAKAEVFHEGDHVVYPTHGVGKVERIATEEIAGHKLELIHITFEENRMTLRVPVAKARTAGLRKLATRKLFDEALNVLKGRARIKRTMWSRRAQEYEAKINSGDPLAIAEVVRDLHRNAGQPDQSFSERQIYEAAMERLAAELAALDKTDKVTAATKLTDFLKTV
jgi:CarD family transcriptional regulator